MKLEHLPSQTMPSLPHSQNNTLGNNINMHTKMDYKTAAYKLILKMYF
jgi:hypothetical protein